MKKSEILHEKDLFNQQLYENFQNSGMLQDLKAKMRYDLVSRLKPNKGYILLFYNIFFNIF